MTKLNILTFLLIFPSLSYAFGVTWEGQLTASDGVTPDSNASRAITMKLYDSDKTCLLYQEDHTVNTNISNGHISIDLGTGTPSGGSGTFTELMFDNTFTQNCLPTGTENLPLLENRKVEVIVAGETLSPDITISLLPAAVYSKQAAVAQSLDPNAVVTASITDQSITDIKMQGITANCSNGEVLKADGSGGFTCATDDAGSGGTVTSIASGVGLTGGPITNTGTLAVDVGTAANQIVQLDGTGKLPAVDGSQLTNISFTETGDISAVTAGTGLLGGAPSGDATLNVDVGTAANQIVQLDGTGKLPAVDGSQLTNLPNPTNSTLLTGFTVGANATITAGDNLLQAVGKIQGQVDATNTTVSGKEDSIPTGTTTQYFRGDKTWQSLDKTDVGLSNVDDVQQLPMTYLDIDTNLGANSDTKVPSQKAIKAYVDAQVSVAGDFQADGSVPMTANLDMGNNDLENISYAKLKADTNDSIASGVIMTKSRAGAVVQADDELGSIEFKGFDTTNAPVTGAYIQAQVEDPPSGSGDMPTFLNFSVREPSSGPIKMRMAIKSNGKIHAGAIHGDPSPPIGGPGCPYDGSSCRCNDEFTFIDFDKSGTINTDECVEPGLIADPLDGVRINGGLFVGAEVNYNVNPGGTCSYDGLSCRCHDGFYFDDSNNDGMIDANLGECVKFGIDVSNDHVQIGGSFSIGQFIDSNPPGAGLGCAFGSANCFCNPGYHFHDKDSNGNIDTGECEGSLFSSSQQHGGTSFGSFEDPQGLEFGAPGCSPTPGTCACHPGSHWDDMDGNGTIEAGECRKGGVSVMGSLAVGTEQPKERFHVVGGAMIEGELQLEHASPAGSNRTIYRRAKGTPGAPASVANNDVISEQVFMGHDGTNYKEGARIAIVADGTPSTEVPARIEFHTSDGATPPIPRVIISQDGKVGFGTNFPQATVHIQETLKLEPHAAAPEGCNPGNKGLMAFNDALNAPCFCDGSFWKNFSGAGCGAW